MREKQKKMTNNRILMITIAILALVLFTGARAASERRAEYLDAESAYFDCSDSGIAKAECLTILE